MTAAPAISFVIPAYNAVATLPETLDSLLAQTRPDWEAVIVDDGSTDGTADLARRATEDPRIQAFSVENSGASGARNAGLERVRADWVVFLDADDWITPDFAERMLSLAYDDVDLVYCRFARTDASGQIAAAEFEPDLVDRAFQILAQRNVVAIHSVMVRTERVREAGGFDPARVTCEDWDLWLRLARMGCGFCALSETLAAYRIRSGSLSTNRDQLVSDALAVMRLGHERDPRVESPFPDFVDGLEANEFERQANFLVLWYAAAELGAGGDGARFFREHLLAPCRLGEDWPLVCETLLAGLAAGARSVVDAVAGQLARFQPGLNGLLTALTEAGIPDGERHQKLRELEHALIDRASKSGSSLFLIHCGFVVQDVAQLSGIVPPSGIDFVWLRLESAGEPLADLRLPLLGDLSAADVAQLALTTLGEPRFRRFSRVGRRPAYAARLARHGVIALGSDLRGYMQGQRRKAGLLHEAHARARREAALEAYSGPYGSHEARLRAQLLQLGKTPQSPRTEWAHKPGSAEPGRAAYWDGIFQTLDPWNYGSVYEQTKYLQTLELLPAGPIKKALELACAEGHFTAQLAPRVDRLIAADISRTALERAKERCAGVHNVEFRETDLMTDPLPPDQDVIICSEVLYYPDSADHLRTVLAKLRDALAPGGRLITANFFLLKDDLAATGFEWEQAYGARVIHETAAATPGLRLVESTVTEIYRVDAFERVAAGRAELPVKIVRANHGEPLDLLVERDLVWGGARARRADLALSRSSFVVPLLMYHRVSDEGPPALDRWRIAPDRFDQHLRRLRSLGYHAVNSEDLLNARTDGRPLPGRPVMISFDDGYQDFADHAWPKLQRRDFNAEVFIVTDRVADVARWDADYGPPAKLMDWPTIERLYREGVRFGSHMASHSDPYALRTDELLAEAVRSRAILQEKLQTPIRSIAAPFGMIDDRLMWAMEKAGYWIGFSTREDVADVRSHLFRMPRIEIRGDWTADDLEAALEIREPEAAVAPRRAPSSGSLVSVIVPAYNAEATIEETLCSVRAQTHEILDIVVVDDGSRDNTPAIVERHVATDSRVRLIRQTNAGVAAARNRGVAEAWGDLIAPVDADDLWAPTKVEKQLRALEAGGEDVGLVYCWSAVIDGNSRVFDHCGQPSAEGEVLQEICRGNFVGNGSSPLLRKRAILESGGYELLLRANKAQGCEDLLLYFRVAERYKFGLVPEYLTGYRDRPDTMSGDLTQMLRSFRLVTVEMRDRHPAFARETREGEAYLASWLFSKARRAHRPLEAAQFLWVALRRDWNVGRPLILRLIKGGLRSLFAQNRSEEEGVPVPWAGSAWTG